MTDPTLSPEVVVEDELLAEAVDAFVGGNSEATKMLAWIVDEQDRLRACAEPDIWQLILQVDELAVARWADSAVAIARWSFHEGRRFPVSSSESPP